LFGLVLLVGLAAAQPATAACFCPAVAPWQNTGNIWGLGADCSAARTNLIFNAQADADASCENGACAFGALTINTACHQSDMPGHTNEKQEDGSIQFKCRVCGPGGGGGGGGGPQ